MSLMVSFCAIFFPRNILDEILNLIKSVAEGFPTYTFIVLNSILLQNVANHWTIPNRCVSKLKVVELRTY